MDKHVKMLDISPVHAHELVTRPEMETGHVDWHRSGRPAGRITGRVEILRPAGQAG